MWVLIRVEGETEDGGLLPWLLDDPVGKDAEFLSLPGAPGEMGVGDIIQAVIADTTALGSLVVAVATWLDTHRGRSAPAPQVRIEQGSVSVTVTGDEPEEIARIVRALCQAPGDGPRADP
jgi:hypothetical protein